MDFDLTEDQREIKSVAHELLAARSPMAKVREAAEAGEYDAALWNEIVELGWPGIAVAEEYGGQGLGAVELAVLLEELGYACAATPLLSTAVAAAVIQAGGTDEQRARWLPGLVGRRAHRRRRQRGAGRRRPRRRRGGAARRRRRAAAGRRDGRGRALVDDRPDAALRARPGRRRAARAPAPPTACAPAIAAEVVGVCQRALEMTLEYVKDRKQFGVPVGSFQAVAHRCAQMLLHTESARSTAYFAAWAADADPSGSEEAAALAAAAAATGGREVAASAIQAHGGIGFTWEADVHWLYKRAEVDRALLGGAGRHHAALARAAAERVAVAAS